MFNAERLLGGLLRSGMRRGHGMGSLVTGGAALGLLGVAMEAAEHFMNRNQAGANTSTAAGTPPPMSMPGASRSAGPPPPPTGGASTAPPPSPPGSSESRQNDAVVLIRAMIAAANADGIIDAQERTRILDKLKTVSLSEDERQFIIHELLEPKDIDTIVGGVSSDELGRQVYMVSLAAIEVDTDAERSYLKQLAEKLRLQSQQVEEIHMQMGVPVDLV